ncbi:hypothetical protein [Kribbella catacumbae]|uniref:hypothetical protein n=1 Tax=Kribbella catacumbae TaxID=460086 RepID=UPI0003A54657|nr:hypothetical protein [Kribbella catacumbae]
MKVVLLSTRRLPPSYFDTVRADLGGREDLALDVVAWVPPAGPVDGLVNSFTLIGPGKMPVEVVPPAAPVEAPVEADEVPVGVSESAKAPAPEAVTDEAAVESTATEADEVAEGDQSGGSPTGGPTTAPAGDVAEGDELGSASSGEASALPASTPAEVAAGDEAAVKVAPAASKPAAKPRPTGAKRVVKAAQWRARKLRRAGGKMLPAAIKKSGPVKKLTANRKADNLAKTYWNRVLGRADVMTRIEQADVVIALDGGSVWAGWQVGQRKPQTPVVLGVPAARRELDRLVGAGQE